MPQSSGINSRPAQGLSRLPGLAPPSRDLLMIKDSVAARLRDEIIGGQLLPGERIIEGAWAKRLGVAQSSIRDAINALSAEGFVTKDSGRSAMVTQLSAEDVSNIYHLRAVLEGLAGRSFVERGADLTDLRQLLADMKAALDQDNILAFYERDLRFHMLIAERSGNKHLEQALRRVVVPLFAFVVVRVGGTHRSSDRWIRSLEEHHDIVRALSSGDPVIAEQQIRNIVSRFLDATEPLIGSQVPSKDEELTAERTKNEIPPARAADIQPLQTRTGRFPSA